MASAEHGAYLQVLEALELLVRNAGLCSARDLFSVEHEACYAGLNVARIFDRNIQVACVTRLSKDATVFW
jgi:hypothetical protein